MNRYSYSGSLNTEQYLSAYVFNLHAAARYCPLLIQCYKRNMDHAGTDRHTCREIDGQADGWAISWADGLFGAPRRPLRHQTVRGVVSHIMSRRAGKDVTQKVQWSRDIALQLIIIFIVKQALN